MEEITPKPMNVGHRKTIGEINGPFAFLFKVTQILIPVMGLIIIPFCVHVEMKLVNLSERIVKLEEYREERPKYATAEIESVRLRIMAEVADRVKVEAEKLNAATTALADKVKTDTKDLLVEMKSLTLAIHELKIKLVEHMSSEDRKKL